MVLDRPLLVFWILSSTTLLGLGLLLILRTRMLRKRWRGEEAVGRKVLVSEDWGPAVVGLVHPQIVLPGWCRSLGEETLRLILDHEVEHLEAGDLRVLWLAGVFPVLFPWSLPAWWMWHRLRLAVEGDCDLRVLRRNPLATRAYMELLLEVGQRLPRGRVAAAMLSEPERTLARRIRTMTMPVPKKPVVRGLLLVVAGGILVAAACAVPAPSAVNDEAQPTAEEAVAEEDPPALSEVSRQLMEAPTPTPFTDPPGLRNREEVTAALESEYPPLLREAGIGGTATVWFFIDEEGVPRRVMVRETSGHKALDEAALRVAGLIRFSPARNREEPVPVWIALPIRFTAPESGSAPVQAPERAASGIDSVTPPPEAARGAAAAENPSESPTFTPFTVRPDIANRGTVARAMEAEYPPLVRDAGIGGTAVVWFFIDETGATRRALLRESSGHKALDEAALRVAEQVEFTPALNGEEPVPVWIALPITFSVR